ncbi:hypothetical protein WT06_07240 [Burkholderia anthina]|nr:hypothetical protein WT06_07240 [Burkholderia anthina]
MHKAALNHGFAALELPANWKMLVGMAGMLAEEILSGETDDTGAMAHTLFYRISFGEASASNLALMGVTNIDSCGLTYEVVDEVVRILREGWSVVQEEAEYLIASATS